MMTLAPGLQVQSGDEQAVEARLFAAVCWGPGDPATTMVMLNRDGQLVDVLYAGQLSGAIRRTRRSAQGVEDIFSDPAKARTLSCLPARPVCVESMQGHVPSSHQAAAVLRAAVPDVLKACPAHSIQLYAASPRPCQDR